MPAPLNLPRLLEKSVARMAALYRRLAPIPLSLGHRGERRAAHYLRRKGYVVVAGGKRTRFGEIDLIAVLKRSTLVFVEVKTRRNHQKGHPAEAVDLAKQRRIADAALAFLKSHGLLEQPARFDVIAITWPKGARAPKSIEHFENAFEPPGKGRFFG